MVIGGSFGGIEALRTLLPLLPADFPVPIALVIHRGPNADSVLARQLQAFCPLPVTEPLDKTEIRPGLFLAPPDYHMFADHERISLSTGAPELYSRPSVDVLFSSAADSFASGVTGVVLSGANHDGARGTRDILARGGVVIAQEPASASARAMPEAAIRAGASPVLPLIEIGDYLRARCNP